jgi:hypothetical protein
MAGGNSSGAQVRFWRDSGEGDVTAGLSRRSHRIRLDKVQGLAPTGATRPGRSEAATLGTLPTVKAGSAGGRRPNEPRHVTAARWRMLLNRNGHGGAAALERRR